MSEELKSLYTRLIDDKKGEVEGDIAVWYDRYREFHDQVARMRDRIQAGENLSANTHKEFLDQLLRKKFNGIAKAGRSSASKEKYPELIRNNKFIHLLTQFISETDNNFITNVDKRREISTLHRELGECWYEIMQGNNPVLVKRIAAACTLDVSTVFHEGTFNAMFHLLMDREMIDGYSENEPQDWFSKNVFLVGQIRAIFKNELNGPGATMDKFYLNMFIWELFKDKGNLSKSKKQIVKYDAPGTDKTYNTISKPSKLKKQGVKYGAPGTGKTYQARRQAEYVFDIWKNRYGGESDATAEDHIKLVQFHPSYSYEDFVEGLRPAKGNAGLTLHNGVFKTFCKEAGKWEIDVENLRKDRGLDVIWDRLTIGDLQPHEDELTGDHWLPILVHEESEARVADVVPPFFFIIDEINRAELSRVFGELMYCLEYRGLPDGCIETQYAHLNDSDTAMITSMTGDAERHLFFIPENLHVIGTMNVIDRSLESFDFALRRRFHWEEVKPDIELARYDLSQQNAEWASLADNLKALNTAITDEVLLGADYQIGHAYLMNLSYSDSLSVQELRKHLWQDSIAPLLQEYLRGTGKTGEIMQTFKNIWDKHHVPG